MLSDKQPDERNADFQSRRQVMLDKIAEMDDKIEKRKQEADLPLLTGPVTMGLDTALKHNKIYMQAYHGRSFVGNHCHRYLKEEVCDSVCEIVFSTTPCA